MRGRRDEGQVWIFNARFTTDIGDNQCRCYTCAGGPHTPIVAGAMCSTLAKLTVTELSQNYHSLVLGFPKLQFMTTAGNVAQSCVST